jgi:D-glycero-D-manno-heptose 1,7-bisphosphate phosphatase
LGVAKLSIEIPYVIFDRDGTLIEHIPHLVDTSKIKFKPDLVQGLLKLKDAGFRFGIITNQSVVARGLASFEKVNEINSVILQFLAANEVEIDFVLVCPHTSSDSCECRKPRIGLGITAVKDFRLQPSVSYMVGDQESDIIFGKALGCKSIQLQGNAEKSEFADYYSKGLISAAEWIVSDMKMRGNECR